LETKTRGTSDVPQVTLKKELRSAEELFLHGEKSVMILACVVAWW
jgi:hypothetical protein